MKAVNVVGGDVLVSQMFLKNGWRVVDHPEDADLIQFTGGPDVHPAFYKEGKHPKTSNDPARDAAEWLIYYSHVEVVPMVGICRGAQLLNVFNGGSLWQHVTNHTINGTHLAFDLLHEKNVDVTSTHHQMMIKTNTAVVLMTADQNGQKETHTFTENVGQSLDCEALWYPDCRCLCYQPHPEYVDINHPCQTTYFEYINELLVENK